MVEVALEAVGDGPWALVWLVVVVAAQPCHGASSGEVDDDGAAAGEYPALACSSAGRLRTAGEACLLGSEDSAPLKDAQLHYRDAHPWRRV